MEAITGVNAKGSTSMKLQLALGVAQHHDAVSGTSKQVKLIPAFSSYDYDNNVNTHITCFRWFLYVTIVTIFGYESMNSDVFMPTLVTTLCFYSNRFEKNIDVKTNKSEFLLFCILFIFSCCRFLSLQINIWFIVSIMTVRACNPQTHVSVVILEYNIAS